MASLVTPESGWNKRTCHPVILQPAPRNKFLCQAKNVLMNYPSFPFLGFWFVALLVTKLCLTLCDPMDCSPPASSVHGILQARILVWVATSFYRGPSWPRDKTHVSYIGRWILYGWATRKARSDIKLYYNPLVLMGFMEGRWELNFWLHSGICGSIDPICVYFPTL